MQRANLRFTAIVSFVATISLATQLTASVIHHVINHTATVDADPFGNGTPIDLTTGTVGLVGGETPARGFEIIPSNSGQNMQVQFLPDSGGGVVVTSGAPSFLAQKFSLGDIIDNTILDAPELPGFSTASDVGSGKVRFFGAGNFANGQSGFIGFRLSGDFFGWAEVTAVDEQAFTVHQAAYQNSGNRIEVGFIPALPATCDLDGNGLCNAEDIDLLSDAARTGVFQSQYSPADVEIPLASPGATDIALVYDIATGNLVLDTHGLTLTTLELRSADGIFVGDTPAPLNGLFDVSNANQLFKLDPAGFGNVDFGPVLAPGLTIAAIGADLTADGSPIEGGPLPSISIVDQIIYSWTSPDSGDWGVPNNWGSENIPNENTHTAIFGNAIGAPETVFTNTAVTLKNIVFDNAFGYAVAGQGSVELEADADNTSFDVLQGNHQFQAIVNLRSSSDLNTVAGTSLTFHNALNLKGHTLSKTGLGEMVINNDLSTGGGTLNCDEGVCSGSGTIGGDVNNAGGMISPGNSLGVLAIEGNFTQGEDGIL